MSNKQNNDKHLNEGDVLVVKKAFSWGVGEFDELCFDVGDIFVVVGVNKTQGSVNDRVDTNHEVVILGTESILTWDTWLFADIFVFLDKTSVSGSHA